MWNAAEQGELGGWAERRKVSVPPNFARRFKGRLEDCPEPEVLCEVRPQPFTRKTGPGILTTSRLPRGHRAGFRKAARSAPSLPSTSTDGRAL
ncbi:hypothetical protein Efla_002871 [Eimeria flavescens]